MKNLLAFLFLWPSLLMAQFDHDVYFDLSADANKLTGLIDNPRTVEDHRGLDFDAEIGVHTGVIGVYLFYGRFEAADYQNYGFGMDYYLVDGDWYDIAIGAGISRIMRKVITGAYYQRTAWADLGGYANYHGRLSGTFWVFRNLGVSGKLQYQRRPDIEAHGIIEGAIGVRYKFNKE